MSALLVDELDVLAPGRPQPKRWRHVARKPEARPQLVLLPGGRPGGVAAPELRSASTQLRRPGPRSAPAQLRLTERGLAVVVVFFLALLATAAVVLVTSFLAVSDAAIPSGPAASVVVSGQG